ncbi:MAG: hypothetical protein ABIJ09_02495 [Pseudomonadota bacterium]
MRVDRTRILLVATLGLLMLAAGPVLAKGGKKEKSDRFVDAKQRFSLRIPHGWELAPLPGDLYGMMFRRKIGDVPALFRAHVEKARDDDTLTLAADRLTRDFSQEIGYRKLTDLPAKVNGIEGVRRTHSVFLSGDRNVVRYAVDTVILAYGHVHFMHFETTESGFASFKEDLEALLRSYRPLVGRKTYAPIIGEWELVGAASPLRLSLRPDLVFALGDKRGHYRADGSRLTFIGSDGRETFDYDAGQSSLVVRNESLGGPMAYRRVGATAPDLADVPVDRTARPTLVGRWKVVDSDLELVLSPSGSVQFGPLSGRYRVKGALLTITSTAGMEMTYHTSLRAGRLTLSGGDLDRPLLLERE